MKLTKRNIDSFEYNGGQDIRWDGVVTGLGLRIYPTGKKAFILRYRFHGQKKLKTLGRYGGDMTLNEARIQAREDLRSVRNGVDPLEEKRKAKNAGTMRELFDRYITHKRDIRKTKTWKTDEGRIGRHLPKSWENRKAKSIKPREIDDVHKDIGKSRPYEANRVRDLLHNMFELAAQPAWGFVPENHRNPVSTIEKFPEFKRKRYATPEEVKSLAAAIDKQDNIYVRAALWLYLLTGMRKSELLEARRDQIDWERARFRLPDTKAGEEQVVALSAAAMTVLKAIPQVEGNPYLLPGRRREKHLVNISKRWMAIRKAAGCEDLRLHDLRRSVGSWLSQSGVDLNTIRDALRHTDISTTLAYARLGEDPAREAMEAHGEAILRAAGDMGPLRIIEGGKE